MFTIKWRNRDTGTEGSGLYLHDRDIAQSICNVSIGQNPDLERWVAEEEP